MIDSTHLAWIDDMRADREELNNLADPDGASYDQELLAMMNSKLNALIEREIGEDKALFSV